MQNVWLWLIESRNSYMYLGFVPLKEKMWLKYAFAFFVPKLNE
jgi:hypothetical protein